jgi:hypothetical protein
VYPDRPTARDVEILRLLQSHPSPLHARTARQAASCSIVTVAVQILPAGAEAGFTRRTRATTLTRLPSRLGETTQAGDERHPPSSTERCAMAAGEFGSPREKQLGFR